MGSIRYWEIDGPTDRNAWSPPVDRPGTSAWWEWSPTSGGWDHLNGMNVTWPPTELVKTRIDALNIVVAMLSRVDELSHVLILLVTKPYAEQAMWGLGALCSASDLWALGDEEPPWVLRRPNAWDRLGRDWL